MTQRLTRSTCGSSTSDSSVTDDRLAVAGRRSAHEALELGRRHERARLRDPRERGVDRRRRSRGRPAGSRARTRASAGTRRSGRRAPGRRPQHARAADVIVVLQVARLGGERGRRGVEVGDEVLEVLVVGRQRARTPSAGPAISFDRSCGCAAEQRLVHDRDAAQRLRASSRASLFSACAARVAACTAVILVGVLAGQRLAVERGAVALDAGPGGCLRVSAWSAVSTWSSWTGLAVCVIGIVPPSGTFARARRARLEVDEEVALEEDARAHLHLGVLVDRQAARRSIVIVITDVVVSSPARSTLLHLADVHAGDPHGRARLDVRAFATTAFTSYGLENGMSLAEHDERDDRDQTITIAPATAGEMRSRWSRRFLRASSWRLPARRGALVARARCRSIVLPT